MKLKQPSQSARAKAQELAYDAMESSDDRKAVQLGRKSLEIYPDCTDDERLLI